MKCKEGKTVRERKRERERERDVMFKILTKRLCLEGNGLFKVWLKH